MNTFNNWAEQMLLRIEDYINSIEFTHLLDLPPDFHIEFAIFNFHVWLIVRRLQREKSKKAELMWKCLLRSFERYTQREIMKIHLRKKNDFVKDINYFAEMNRNTFEKHFYSNYKTAQNPYYKVDALVWSTIFYEKVERYSDRVYLMAEYCVAHFRYINTLSVDEIYASQIDFDLYRNSLDFKEKIQEVNPPLTEEEFEEELNSENKIKSFFYNYDDPSYQMPIDMDKKKAVDRRLVNLMLKVDRTVRKFDTMETYDFYSDREEREKEAKRKEKKYPWVNSKDRDLEMYLSGKTERDEAYSRNK